MKEITDIILKRKYFFHLPTLRLFEHLIYREVPEIHNCTCDHINELYTRYDDANDVNRSFDYHEQITLKAITFMKEPAQRYNAKREWLQCGKRRGLLRPIIIWKYLNKAVIVRIHDEFMIDDLHFHFRYIHFDSINHYFAFEKLRGTAIDQNQFLFDIASKYYFDFWYLHKLMNRSRSENEQKILG
jgi:hypothetical protein